MRKRSEAMLVLPLLPIFVAGMFPMLMIGMLGFAGLIIFGILMVRVGLAGTMEAHGDFNQELIAHGYASGPERAAQVSGLRSRSANGRAVARSRLCDDRGRHCRPLPRRLIGAYLRADAASGSRRLSFRRFLPR